MGKGWKSGEATTSCARTEETAAGRTAGNSDAADAAVITNQEEIVMKIAVTYENGQVFQHFGHTEEFKVYDTEDKKILSSQVVGTGGSGCVFEKPGSRGADLRRNRRRRQDSAGPGRN